MSGPRTFFGDIGFFVFFWFSSFFLAFGSGSFYRLLRLPKTQKPRKKPKKPKTPKKPKHSEECLGQGLSLETLFFFVFFGFFGFCWFSSSFFGFWFRKLLPATKTTKNPKTLKKNTHKKGFVRNVWAKGFVQKHCSLWLSGSSQVLVVCFFPCFVQTCSHKLFSYFHTHDIPCLPVAGLCRGSAPRDAWHRTQVSIPEPNAFTHPKPMATSLHAIQKKILPTHP